MTARILLLIATAFLIHACGGGGGSPPVTVVSPPPVAPDDPEIDDETPPVSAGPSRLPFPYVHTPNGGRPPYNLAPAPAHELADVHRIPVYQDSERLLVGIDQTATHIAALRAVEQRNDTIIHHGSLADGGASNDLATYLGNALPLGASRFEGAPSVRFIGHISDRTKIDRALEAVRLVNAALPDNFKIRVPSTTPVARPPHFLPARPYNLDNTAHRNTIYIEFVNELPGAGNAHRWRKPGDAVHHAYIRLRDNLPYGNDNPIYATGVIAHELLHALGLSHVPSELASILDVAGSSRDTAERPLSILHPLDREALRILYTRLDNKDDPTTFGPWANTSVHIAGNGPHANFGVALRNGYAEPWAYGLKPATALFDNTTLSGTATWNGSLVGLTPSAASVIGDATIGVDLTTMTGRADFTALESWAAGTAPGPAGTGLQWLDGDLGYSISVRGNTFQETGGDAGTLTGVFTGSSHEGVAGTLQRTDLTAAFGGARQ